MLNVTVVGRRRFALQGLSWEVDGYSMAKVQLEESPGTAHTAPGPEALAAATVLHAKIGKWLQLAGDEAAVGLTLDSLGCEHAFNRLSDFVY